MDGAIILAADASRIARANVHLVPRASIPTSETGTRHRTAERVARSIEVPVITVSEAMSTIAVYRNDAKHTLQRTGRLVDRATQALSTVQRFKSRFDLAVATLSTLEVEDTVSVRDVVAVLQPGEMVVAHRRGDRGLPGRAGRRRPAHPPPARGARRRGAKRPCALVVRDYVGRADDQRRRRRRRRRRGAGAARDADRRRPRPPGRAAPWRACTPCRPRSCSTRPRWPATLGLGSAALSLDAGVEARGYRLLQPPAAGVRRDHRAHRATSSLTLPRILQASLGDLETVGGVGGAKARSVKDGLARMVEASILERYE